MKINVHSAVGNPEDPKTWSGTPYHITNELRRLNKLGTIFQPQQTNLFRRMVNKLFYIYYARLSYAKVGGLLGWRQVRRNAAAVLAGNLATAEWKDILHFGTLGLPFYTKPIGHRQYLYTDGVWNLWSQYSPDVKNYPLKLISEIEKLETEAYIQMDCIFSVSNYVRENLINHYKVNPKKIIVVGTGTGVIQPFMGEKDYNNGKILFVAKGRFIDKGGELVLSAFEKALQKNPALQLTIVGQNDYTRNIAHPKIKTYGYVSIEELQTFFNDHSLFVMPALNEPWGLVYIEAMLCKMPIVGLNRNGFPEISGYGKYGNGINEQDADELASMICNYFQNSELMQSIGLAAQNHAIEHYSWQKTTHKIINTIKQLNEQQHNSAVDAVDINRTEKFL